MVRPKNIPLPLGGRLMEQIMWDWHAGKLGRNHTVISQLVRKYQQTNDVKKRHCQQNLVKHLHEETGRYYDLFDVAPFPAARS